jgi:hypothetical protein
MNKPLFTLFASLLFLTNGVLLAQSKSVDLGLFRKSANSNKLDIRLRPTEDVVNGAYSGGVFTVRFPSSYGVTLSVVPNTAMYSYAFAGPVGQFEGYDYYRYQFAGSVNTVNWQKGKEYPLITLQINGTTPPRAKFELVTNVSWTRSNNANYYQELNGAGRQRTFYQTPIRVRSFNAIGQPNRTVKLDWEFESDTELAFSEVEYSADGREFSIIGTEAANNESDRTDPTYRFTHKKPQTGINYYRIRMVDINGVVEHSQVRAINFDDLEADFSVFPNPTSGPLTLVSRNLAKFPAGVNYQLIDNAGKVILFNTVKDDNVTLDLSKMPSGPYYLQVMTDAEQLAKFQVVIAN